QFRFWLSHRRWPFAGGRFGCVVLRFYHTGGPFCFWRRSRHRRFRHIKANYDASSTLERSWNVAPIPNRLSASIRTTPLTRRHRWGEDWHTQPPGRSPGRTCPPGLRSLPEACRRLGPWRLQARGDDDERREEDPLRTPWWLQRACGLC